MAGEAFSIGYDSQSAAQVARMFEYQAILGPRLGSASRGGAELIIKAIPRVTSWANGTGTLDNSFYIAQSTNYSSIVTSDLPYAHRRDVGFHGSDSLGRVYDDEGAFYAEKAIELAQNDIENLYIEAIELSFSDLAV